MRIVSMSDTHLRHDFTVPDGDVLIHAGDALLRGTFEELRKFSEWFRSLPHRWKIFVAGNHDWPFEKAPNRAVPLLLGLPSSIIYLQDSGLAINGVSFWGSPWQPWFLNWAFNLPRGKALADKWSLIPEGTDVLITHGPPRKILDRIPSREHVGCEDLLKRVVQLKPKLHVFGHVHHSAGQLHSGGTEFVNACICDESYLRSYLPTVTDL